MPSLELNGGICLFHKVTMTEKTNTNKSVDQKQKSLQDAIVTAQVCDEYRGRDTVILDLREVTPVFDFFVITTGNVRRQLHAIADEVDRVLQERGSKRIGLEGYRGEGNWVLQDYGDIVLHVFTEETRKLYDLENLWADGVQIDWKKTSN
ncbi:Ribosomal silencing factor RsfA [hydrothermal vent metagenome]|uniref:Ribosomal silencing factor RsfA n=1 Tax=hydrothermal vent metagenome TaxID=652676 RepID=A0A3B1D9Z8_9ZZZZ